MTDILPQRDPGATLPPYFERLSEVRATVVASRDEPDGQGPRSFSRDEETMRRIAEGLPQWTGIPQAD
ncbi:hypothetical protein OHB12_06055 [Nocardia sp. NBC_01730]|uniref:hypothetical protein n=1 Tax=Nocardia sp. NBC_01730 TaxID=2975998 RepID=UPI002E12C260|nr:hypothetical protein OHB12_06055 [Nocardia sp. NBC_01730]